MPPHPTHKGFQTIWKKGYDAFFAGKSADECPYPVRFSQRGHPWNTAGRLAWIGGYSDAEIRMKRLEYRKREDKQHA